MAKWIIGIVVVLVVVGGGAWLMNKDKNKSSDKSSSSSQMSNMPSSDNNTNNTPTSTNSVAIQDFAFSPGSITVKKGTTVTWTNKDSTAHNVIGDGNNGPKSDTLGQGKTYSFTFNEVGTFNYRCTFHSGMTGTVTVTE